MLTMLDRPPAPMPLRFTPYSPAPHRHMSQIDISPQIDAPITIDLGTLPLTIGLFAGSGVAFLIGAQVPGARTITTVVGVVLAGAGVLNLLAGSAKGAEAQEPIADVPGSDDGVQVSPPLQDTNEDAFAGISARVVSPSEFAVINTFADNMVPVRIRLTNDSGRAAAFDLILRVKEEPSLLFAQDVVTDHVIRINLGAGETRDIDTEVPIATWGALETYVTVNMDVLKRRLEGGNAERIASRRFDVD